MLRLLARTPGTNQRELATRLGAAPSRVVVLLDSLESRGLIIRRRSTTDRRNHEVALTGDGEAMMRSLRTVAKTHEASFLQPLSKPERDQLGCLLAKLADAHHLDPQVHPGMTER